jgi:hypothetical protein
MSKLLYSSLMASPMALAATIVLSASAIAAPTETEPQLTLTAPVSTEIPAETAATKEAEVNNRVAANSDTFKPGDAQFDTLRALQAKFGCQTNTLGETPVSRADFLNSLSACLNRVEPAMAANQNTIAAADIESLQRLTQEFRGELTNLERRIDRVDTRIAQGSSSNQFSTTTKLNGEVVFNLSGAVSGSNSNNTVFGNRARLLLTSSFNGTDKLFTRLAAGNLGNGVVPDRNTFIAGGTQIATREGTQVVDGYTNNSVSIDWLAYQFTMGKNTIYLPVHNGIHSDYVPTYSPYFEDFTGGNGAISAFAESSPIYKVGGGAGIGTTFDLGNGQGALRSVTVGYLASNASNATGNNGFFNGSYALLGQLNFKLSEQFEGGLTYVNAYHVSGFVPATPNTPEVPGRSFFGGTGTPTGTGFANLPIGNYATNLYGIQGTYRVSDKLTLNGFVLTGNGRGVNGTVGSGDIFSFGVGAALPNLWRQGDVAGVMIGIEPYLTSTSPNILPGNTATPWHFEGFYKYKLADNISITPGFIYISNPNQTSGNSAFIGTLRTTFTF